MSATDLRILDAARAVTVTCGVCQQCARPTEIVAVVSRVIEHRGDFTISKASAVVLYRCDTPACVIGAGAGIALEVPT